MRTILPLLLFFLLATGLLYPEFQVSLSASENIATIGDRITRESYHRALSGKNDPRSQNC
jgi:hypothetical protein